jgi:transcriptional regulator with XRE-family HTH domain
MSMDILLEAKKKNRLKYADITEKTGLHKSIISKVLNGTTYASLSMYIKIGTVLGVPKKDIQQAWKKKQIEKIETEIAASNNLEG